MKLLRYLVLALFSIGYTCVAESNGNDIQNCSVADEVKSANDNHVASMVKIMNDWENVIHKALTAEKSSTLDRLDTGVKREIAKNASVLAVIVALLGDKFGLISDDSCKKLLVTAAIACWILSFVDLGAKITEKDDEFLKALESVNVFASAINHFGDLQFVPDLTPEARAFISKMYKEEYSGKLKTKLVSEKDGFVLKAGRSLLSMRDLILTIFPLFAACMTENEVVFSAGALALVLQLMVVKDKVWSYKQQKREEMLNNIDAMFNYARFNTALAN